MSDVELRQNTEQIHFMVELQSFAEVLVLTVQVLCSGSTGPMLHPLVLPESSGTWMEQDWPAFLHVSHDVLY